MADVRPFHGYLFKDPRSGRGGPCVAPPYDVLDAEDRAHFAALSPANVVHLTLPEAAGSDDKYVSARRLLERMIADGRLARDAEPRFYLEVATLPGAGGRDVRRVGLVGVVRADDVGSDAIRGHEQVMPKPVEDRWRLMTATRANLEPVFLLARDADGRLRAALDPARAQPIGTAELPGRVRYDFLRLGADAARTVHATIANAPLYIADGHHRFTVAARFRKEHPELPGASHRLAVIVPAEDTGLVVLPTHRFVEALPAALEERLAARLAEHFELKDVAPDDVLRSLAAERRPDALAIWLRRRERCVIARPRPAVRAALADVPDPLGSLDVVVLHRFLLDEHALGAAVTCTYVRGEDDPIGLARARDVAAAAFLRPPSVATVLEVADQRRTMPPKSTYFHPKAASGHVLFRLDEPIG